MHNFLKSLLLTIALIISGCSAPRPPKISFFGKMKPVNFECRNIYDSPAVIKSEQIPGFWKEQFTYSIDEQKEQQLEFFYCIAHADKIILKIKPSFVEFVFEKTKAKLRSYGATASIELIIEEENESDDNDSNSQVTIECIKHKK